jgi:hypothetical protein
MSNNKSPVNSKLSDSASDNDGEGKKRMKTLDLIKKQDELSLAESRQSSPPTMVLAQMQEETFATGESDSNEVVDLLKQCINFF